MGNTAERIRAKVAKGRAKLAQVLGRPYAHKRPLAGSTDMAQATQLATITGHFDRDPNFSAKKAALYTERTEFAALSAAVLPGDYLVGTEATYFVATPDDLTPVTVVRCNEVITISRPASTGGLNAYAGNTAPVAVAVNWPVRMTTASKGDSPVSGLPEAVKQSNKEILMPAIEGMNIHTAYEIEDSRGDQWRVNAVEQTHLGLRLQVEQATVS